MARRPCSMLPAVRKMGNMVKPLLIGDQGQAAVIKYDHRVEVIQDFTSDGDQITQSIAKIYPGSSSSRTSASPSVRPSP